MNYINDKPMSGDSPKPLKNKSVIALVHLLCWSLFAFYEVGYLFYSGVALEPVYVYFLYYGINIAFFYGQASLFRRLFNRSHPAYYAAPFLFLLLFAVYLGGKTFLDLLLLLPGAPRGFAANLALASKRIPGNIYRGIYFSMLSVFYWSSGYISYYRKRVAAAEKKELLVLKDRMELESRLREAENAYLRQQINPHLLFNSLNFIYSRLYQYSPDAARAVWLLSELLRFSLEASGPDGKTELVKEAEHLGYLLEINKFRYNEELCLQMVYSGDFAQFRVIPLVLMTLTENIFKHGNLRDPEHRALVELSITPSGVLRYYSRNLKKKRRQALAGTGIGLSNLRLRLNHAYPGCFKLSVAETETIYELTLMLQL